MNHGWVNCAADPTSAGPGGPPPAPPGRAAAGAGAAAGGGPAGPADLVEPEVRVALVKRVAEAWGGVDILVNNAGFGYYGDIDEMPEGVIDEMVAVNLLAAIHLTRMVLPDMKARGGGHIVNIGSLGSYVAAPPLTMYAVTKFGMVGFSDGLRRELRGHPGVHVTLVCPGPARTAFGQIASGVAVDPDLVPGGTSAEAVARAVLRGLRRPGRREILVPFYWQAAPKFSRLVPWVVDVVAAWMGRRWLRRVEEVRRDHR
jgi:uncharacterized protein